MQMLFRVFPQSLIGSLGTGMVVLLLLVAGGCGDGRPQRVPVSGRVMIDGKPLTVGTVQVVPDGNRAATGTIGPDGRFTLSTFGGNDGCVLGKHPVAVMGNKILSATRMQWFAPKEYSFYKTSGLEIEVTGPRDDVEINLTWKGGKPFVERLEGGK